MARISSAKKSASAFRTISEVAKELDVQQHVLRFWETKFNQIKPLKRGGGRRYYRPEDILLLKHIHGLLYKEGYTIKGVQKLLKGQTKGQIASNLNETHSGQSNSAVVRTKEALPVKKNMNSQYGALNVVLSDLKEIKSLLAKQSM